MDNNKIAHDLIEWFRKTNYYKMFKADGIACAREDLRKIQELYGPEAIKKAYKHSNCTSIGNFRMLCKELSKQHKQ